MTVWGLVVKKGEGRVSAFAPGGCNLQGVVHTVQRVVVHGGAGVLWICGLGGMCGRLSYLSALRGMHH